MKKILIVDDSIVEVKIIRRLLGSKYEVIEAFDGKSAIEMANKFIPDLILLDIIMPDIDGFSVCKLLKEQTNTADIPIIFITAASAVQDIVKGFEVGGQDYITKPFHSQELCARVKVHLDLKKTREDVQAYATEMANKNKELKSLLVRLEAAATTDFTTGLINRRGMTQRIKSQIAAIKRRSESAIIIFADIDNFKSVNDTYGHECGDKVIKKIANSLKSILREEDVISRWGGDEFLLMLPNTDIDGGKIAAEKIRQSVLERKINYQGKTFSVTLTLGVTELEPELDLDANIKKADQALYCGKYADKNCVYVAGM
jgi:diguanylate cyclase (GGDEF)-like protein